MSNALDFSPAKRSKAGDSASSKKSTEKPFTQVGVVTEMSCGDVDCALGFPKDFLIKKSAKSGAVYYTCTSNVRNTLTSFRQTISCLARPPTSAAWFVPPP